ncbi:MAG: HK97 family phage prohead protease [Anaerorhabdus sp.]|uniref:HK97 family phage prohead protease n=1 Tax=Anaerorhabdus sp. TaxID=1872524 RepID=UPI003A836AB7
MTKIKYYDFDVELRAIEENEERWIEGYAIKFESISKRRTFLEKISKRALDNTDMTDVVFLLNHDLNTLMAGTRNLTLSLLVDDIGLKIKAKPIDTITGADVYKLVKEGLLNKMSFAFIVDKDSWEQRGDSEIRTIESINKIFDVSVVTFPAYEGTSVQARDRDSVDNLAEEHLKRKEQSKKMEEILNA